MSEKQVVEDYNVSIRRALDVLKKEDNDMPKSRPRYQQPFSLADNSFYHLTTSSSSRIPASMRLLKGKDIWLTRAAQEDQVFQTLPIHCSLVHEANLSYHRQYFAFVCFACLKSKEIPETWANELLLLIQLLA